MKKDTTTSAAPAASTNNVWKQVPVPKGITKSAFDKDDFPTVIETYNDAGKVISNDKPLSSSQRKAGTVANLMKSFYSMSVEKTGKRKATPSDKSDKNTIAIIEDIIVAKVEDSPIKSDIDTVVHTPTGGDEVALTGGVSSLAKTWSGTGNPPGHSMHSANDGERTERTHHGQDNNLSNGNNNSSDESSDESDGDDEPPAHNFTENQPCNFNGGTNKCYVVAVLQLLFACPLLMRRILALRKRMRDVEPTSPCRLTDELLRLCYRGGSTFGKTDERFLYQNISAVVNHIVNKEEIAHSGSSMASTSFRSKWKSNDQQDAREFL